MHTLRSVFAAMLLAALCPVANGQSPHRQLFLVDPYETNGYFLVDQEQFDALGLDRIEVRISAAQLDGRSIKSSRELEAITIANSFYGKADLSKILDITANERVYYEAIGYNAAGDIVIDVQSLPTGWYEWPEACRQTCDARWYSWTLAAYDDPLSNHNVIEIQPGSMNGLVPRVYIRPGVNPNTGVGYWQEFQDQFDPYIHFGMSGFWSEILTDGSGDITQVPAALVPATAMDYQGNLLGGVSEPVYAVRKDKGPWVGLYQYTDPIDHPAMCSGGQGSLPLTTWYNADGRVISSLANGGPSGAMDPLSCETFLQSGGGLTWGNGYSCSNFNFYELPGVPISLPNATISVVGCVTLTNVNGGPWPAPPDTTSPGIAGVMVNEWSSRSRTTILSVPFPSNKDPKLVPMRRTVLDAGLYEFVIILDDGRLMSIFQEVKESLTLTADFSSFTNITVYPVPVNDRYFAVDFDAQTPMNITMTVINNMGVNYYTKELEFELAGRNKHVVRMNEQWPAGLYHARFQFRDGSMQSRSFLVETP
jgi:hypothetical protein